MIGPTRVREILAELDVQPSKSLGQNFLIDGNILDIILAASDVTEEDSVLEIGPGLGVLTAALLERAKRVHAIEKDSVLAAYLARSLGEHPGFSIEEADACGCDLERLPERGITKVVSNLPYNVASRILMSLSMGAPVEAIVATVQREVAERVVAPPGGKDYGLLSLWLRLPYEAEIVKHVSPNCFRPRPAVWSSVVRLTRRRNHLLADGGQRRRLYALSREAFAHRRKQLAPLLAKLVAQPRQPAAAWHDVLQAMGLPHGARPEDLAPETWCELVAGPLNGGRLVHEPASGDA
jgi:16S rRNA (adenine1518-N6/adenine1519-N6)-dimethyltransferase